MGSRKYFVAIKEDSASAVTKPGPLTAVERCDGAKVSMMFLSTTGHEASHQHLTSLWPHHLTHLVGMLEAKRQLLRPLRWGSTNGVDNLGGLSLFIETYGAWGQKAMLSCHGLLLSALSQSLVILYESLGQLSISFTNKCYSVLLSNQ